MFNDLLSNFNVSFYLKTLIFQKGSRRYCAKAIQQILNFYKNENSVNKSHLFQRKISENEPHQLKFLLHLCKFTVKIEQNL